MSRDLRVGSVRYKSNVVVRKIMTLDPPIKSEDDNDLIDSPIPSIYNSLRLHSVLTEQAGLQQVGE